MKARYFEDTDTLYLEFRDTPAVETRELDENTLIDVDAKGGVCSMTIEHASIKAQAPAFTYECLAP
jgi:uncharacterized protein YuzE